MLELLLSTSLGKPSVNRLTRPTTLVYGNAFGSCVDYATGNIYCVGGQLVTAAYSPVLQRYNIATDTWTNLASIPEAADRFAVMECIGNFLYYNTGSVTYSYNIATNVWTKMTPPTYGTVYWQIQSDSFVKDGLIYRVGRDSNNTPPGIITSWNVANNTYATTYRSESGSLWSNSRCTIHGNTVYIAGVIPYTTIKRYGFGQGLLAPIVLPNELSVGLGGFMITHGDWIYFNRGNGYFTGTNNFSTDFYRYNPVTEVFEQLPNLPQASFNGCAYIVGDLLYLYGGTINVTGTPAPAFFSVVLPSN